MLEPLSISGMLSEVSRTDRLAVSHTVRNPFLCADAGPDGPLTALAIIPPISTYLLTFLGGNKMGFLFLFRRAKIVRQVRHE